MAHSCKEPGCTASVFGGGFCRYHAFRRYMRGGDLYKPKKKEKSAIPKESKKRKVERKRYTEVCEELTAELREQNGGKLYCFFSGQEITIKKPPYHHLKGRTGDHYIDKEWLVPNINEYHLDYHHKSIEWLLQQEWYTKVFLVNLRTKSEELYRKELKRQEKQLDNISRPLFKDEDFD